MSATLGPTPAAVHVQGEENAGEFPPPPAFPRCQAVVLACIDFQFVEPLHNFLRSRDLVGDFDLVSWPGGAVALGTADRGALLDAVALACDLHRPNELFLIVHHDCGRLGGSTSFAGHYAETATLDTALDIAHEVTAARFVPRARYPHSSPRPRRFACPHRQPPQPGWPPSVRPRPYTTPQIHAARHPYRHPPNIQ